MDIANLSDTEKVRLIEELFRSYTNKESNKVKIVICLGERKQTGWRGAKDLYFTSEMCVVLTEPIIHMKNKERNYHNFEIWGNEGSHFTLVLADFKDINIKSYKDDNPNDFREIKEIYLTTEFYGNEVDMLIRIEKM